MNIQLTFVFRFQEDFKNVRDHILAFFFQEYLYTLRALS